MRKIIVLAMLAVFTAGSMFVYSDMALAAAKDKPKETPKIETKKTEEPSKVVCEFKTKKEMQEFEQLYTAKQAALGRMSVLQAYFSLEQSNLQEIDKQMDKKFNFKMDQYKMYDLNRDSMVIKETGSTPQQPVQQ